MDSFFTITNQSDHFSTNRESVLLFGGGLENLIDSPDKSGGRYLVRASNFIHWNDLIVRRIHKISRLYHEFTTP